MKQKIACAALLCCCLLTTAKQPHSVDFDFDNPTQLVNDAALYTMLKAPTKNFNLDDPEPSDDRADHHVELKSPIDFDLDMPVPSADKPPRRTVLESAILQKIDGIHGLIDGTKIHKSIWLGQEISRFQKGKVDPKTRERIPQHEFHGEQHTLEELVKIEKDSNPDEQFAELLIRLKKEFMSKTTPFLEDARGTKRQMVQLIREWSEKTHRRDSLLLRWSEAQDENQSFQKNVTSFKILDDFCTDLFNFLKTLVRSCPRAFKQYKEWYKKEKKKNKQYA